MSSNARFQTIQSALQQRSTDAMVLLPGPNLLYVSGMHTHASERPLVYLIPAEGDHPAVIIPTLETPKAKQAGIPAELIFNWGDDEGYEGAFAGACAAFGLSGKTIAVESLYMRMLEWDQLSRHAPGLSKLYADPILNEMRARKDDSELAAMRRAIEIAEKAMHAILPTIEIGMTEKEIASKLTLSLMDHGAESIAFGPIVSAGPNGASPHAVPTDRPIAEGDLMVIDWGVFIDDYPSDITRTFAVGSLSEQAQHMYDTVRAANQAALDVVRGGCTSHDIDVAARQTIETAGLGEYFIHRTGHGLGLEVHEEPSIMTHNPAVMRPGMTFTVEPGVYIPDIGGVRIEDNVVVTESGCEVMTTFPKTLIEVG